MSDPLHLGRTEAEWLALLNLIKAEKIAIVSGQRFITVTTGGKTYTRQVRPRLDVEGDYGEALLALIALNPTVYS